MPEETNTTTTTATNNAASMRAWIRTCPAIEGARYFGVDYIGENATEYAIMSVPSSLRYRENILGNRMLLTSQIQNFVFAAKIPYGSDVQQNFSNLAFLQDVADWIREQNAAGNFPDWEGGVITSIECSNTGAPVQTGTAAARYQFQIRVTYKIH